MFVDPWICGKCSHQGDGPIPVRCPLCGSWRTRRAKAPPKIHVRPWEQNEDLF